MKRLGRQVQHNTVFLFNPLIFGIPERAAESKLRVINFQIIILFTQFCCDFSQSRLFNVSHLPVTLSLSVIATNNSFLSCAKNKLFIFTFPVLYIYFNLSKFSLTNERYLTSHRLGYLTQLHRFSNSHSLPGSFCMISTKADE